MPEIVLPAVGGDFNVWGQKLNQAVGSVNDAVNQTTTLTTTGRLGITGLDTTIRARISETIINVRNYGFVADGSTDNSVAMAALVNLVNNTVFPRALYFPGGSDQYVIGSNYTFNVPVRIYGDSPDVSNIKIKNGATGDVFTFNGRSSAFENLYVDANKDNIASGDTVVFNAGYPIAQRVLLANSPGSAIRVGKSARAIVTRLHQVMTRNSRDYGVWVQQDSTDGLWSDLDIGTAGLSGLKVESSSQNMSNVHAWGCGSRNVVGDASGFLVTASGQIMATCQAETNWEDGFTFSGNDQNGSEVSSSKSWANGLAGFAVIGYTRISYAACIAYDNALRNTEGPTSTNRRYAGFYNSGSNHGLMSSCRANDRAVARTVTTPSPIMSKSAVVTQVYGYAEETGSTPFGWAWAACGLGAIVINGNGSTFEGNRSLNAVVPVTFSGNTLPIKADHKIVSVTHATTDTDQSFNSLGTDSQIGRIVTLIIEQTNIVIFENGNIKLINSGFRGATGKQITFQFNGTKWVEISRATL